MAGREGLRGAYLMLRDAGLPEPESSRRDGLARVWGMVFRDVTDDELLAAAVAHIGDTERGQWWPRPADLMRHVETARAIEQAHRQAIESSAESAHLLELQEHRASERQQARERAERSEAIRARREEREAAQRAQAIADGEVYSKVALQLVRYTDNALRELGDCANPRGAHRTWHTEQTMQRCPYRSTVERRAHTRASLSVVGDGLDTSEAIAGIACNASST